MKLVNKEWYIESNIEGKSWYDLIWNITEKGGIPYYRENPILKTIRQTYNNLLPILFYGI